MGQNSLRNWVKTCLLKIFVYSSLSFLLEQISAVLAIRKGLVEAADSEEELVTVEVVEAVKIATVEAV